jgi:hypothetical protein
MRSGTRGGRPGDLAYPTNRIIVGQLAQEVINGRKWVMKRIAKAAMLTAAAGAAVIGTAGGAFAHDANGASADAVAEQSPGVASGNVIQVPVHVPINACGNTVDVIGLLNPTSGSTCVNS